MHINNHDRKNSHLLHTNDYICTQEQIEQLTLQAL